MTESTNAELSGYAANVTARVKQAMRSSHDATNAHQSSLAKIIDGEPARAVEQILGRDVRRASGIFFSGADWADALVRNLVVTRFKRFVDPACGTGDLLLAVARRLPLGQSVATTLASWKQRLIGTDIRPEFVRITRERLRALAILRHGADSQGQNRFSTSSGCTVSVADALTKRTRLMSGDCVLMNPPFHLTTAPDDARCGSGLICAAALFLDCVLFNAPEGVGVFALLPDVLRSGTRYRRLRDLLNSAAKVDSFEPAGRFSTSADVDVALLSAITRQSALQNLSEAIIAPVRKTLGDLFEIHVGNVVPHRTPTKGRWYPYATAVSLPAWQTVSTLRKNARFAARPVSGPFVMVRRTSSPSDIKRARATFLNTKTEVLVENHLIVCTPRNGSVDACRQLLKRLRDIRTDEWLNYRIRCRHLTISALADLPWWDAS